MKIAENIHFICHNNFYRLYDKFSLNISKNNNILIPNWEFYIIKSVNICIKLDTGNNLITIDKSKYTSNERHLLYMNVANFSPYEIIPRNWLKTSLNYLFGISHNIKSYYVDVFIEFNDWENIIINKIYEELPNIEIIWYHIAYNDKIIEEHREEWINKKEKYKNEAEIQGLIDSIKKID